MRHIITVTENDVLMIHVQAGDVNMEQTLLSEFTSIITFKALLVEQCLDIFWIYFGYILMGWMICC